MAEFAVEQGVVRVNHIRVLHQTEDCLVYEADLQAKYAEVQCYAGPVVFLGAHEGTLHLAESDIEITAIRAPVPGDWRSFAEIARYTLVACFFKDHKNLPEGRGFREIPPNTAEDE